MRLESPGSGEGWQEVLARAWLGLGRFGLPAMGVVTAAPDLFQTEPATQGKEGTEDPECSC